MRACCVGVRNLVEAKRCRARKKARSGRSIFVLRNFSQFVARLHALNAQAVQDRLHLLHVLFVSGVVFPCQLSHVRQRLRLRVYMRRPTKQISQIDALQGINRNVASLKGKANLVSQRKIKRPHDVCENSLRSRRRNYFCDKPANFWNFRSGRCNLSDRYFFRKNRQNYVACHFCKRVGFSSNEPIRVKSFACFSFSGQPHPFKFV